MFDDLIVSGYRYADLTFVLPESMDAAKFEDLFSEPALTGLKLRDYVLEGGRIGVEVGELNHVEGKPQYWYTAQASLLPSDQHTDDNIGTLTVEQRTPDQTIVATDVVTLDDLDNGHVLDHLRGAVLELHAKTLGPGPHEDPYADPSAKRTPKP